MLARLVGGEACDFHLDFSGKVDSGDAQAGLVGNENVVWVERKRGLVREGNHFSRWCQRELYSTAEDLSGFKIRGFFESTRDVNEFTLPLDFFPGFELEPNGAQ